MAYNNQYNSNPRNNGTSYVRNPGQTPVNKKNNDSQTDGVLMYNVAQGKFLRTRFWNRFLGIEIGTLQPGTPIDGNTLRNAQTFGHVFSFSVLFELADICNEVIASLKQTNTFESTAIDGNQKKDVIVEISNGSNIGLPSGIYLVIYKNVDTGRRTKEFDFFPFGKSNVMRGYDHNTGNSKGDVKSMTEFRKFVMILNEACKSFTMAAAHSVKEASKMDRFGALAALAAIGAGLGVDLSKSVAAAASSAPAPTNNRPAGNNNGYQRNNYNGGGNNNFNGGFKRTSQPGQWNRSGQYGGSNGGGNSWNHGNTAPAAPSTDDSVTVNLDTTTLQQVDLSNFE